MKRLLFPTACAWYWFTSAFVGVVVFPVAKVHAETFSSSTNFIQTFTLGTNEAIFITTLKYSGELPPSTPLGVTVARSNQVVVMPIRSSMPATPEEGSRIRHQELRAIAGPMNFQFQQANVIMEFQRIKTTNMFTVFLDNTNGTTLIVPSGKTVNFFTPTSWFLDNLFISFPHALITLSNNTTVIRDGLVGGESFSGPLAITLVAGSPVYGGLEVGCVTYYFTEEFATMPYIGAVATPAGNSSIAIEKSLDMTNWGTVFFKNIQSDKSGFYRFRLSK